MLNILSYSYQVLTPWRYALNLVSENFLQSIYEYTHRSGYVHMHMRDMRDITNVSYREDVSNWEQLEQAAK